MSERVMVAMSGGIDSSAAAVLLKGNCADIAGGTMLLHHLEPADAAVNDARAVCDKLEIEHYVFDVRETFKKTVMDFFAESYISGMTPNPCVFCNKTVKFPVFMSFAKELGYDKIATGHYAKIELDEGSGRWLLKKGADVLKDQSYFLYGLSQEILSRTLFPVGALTKSEARELLAEKKLEVVSRPESQDVCFLPGDGDYRKFICDNYGYVPQSGDFIDETGKVLGKHDGALCYTIGQRRGLGVSAASRLYVTGKDMYKNTVTLAPEESLKTTRVRVKDISFIAAEALSGDINCAVKLRYSRNEYPARVIMTGEREAVIELSSPQRMSAPGQSAVFYDGDTVIGGGEIY